MKKSELKARKKFLLQDENYQYDCLLESSQYDDNISHYKMEIKKDLNRVDFHFYLRQGQDEFYSYTQSISLKTWEKYLISIPSTGYVKELKK